MALSSACAICPPTNRAPPSPCMHLGRVGRQPGRQRGLCARNWDEAEVGGRLRGRGGTGQALMASGFGAPTGVSLDGAGFGAAAGEFHEKLLVLMRLHELYDCMR